MRICLFGASSTWGAHDPVHGGWATLLRNYCEKQYDDVVEVYNLGVSGDTTEGLLRRMPSEARERKADLIVVDIGKNDSIVHIGEPHKDVTAEQFQMRMEELIHSAREIARHVLLVGIAPVEESKTRPFYDNICYTDERIVAFDNVIKEIARAHHIPYIATREQLSITDLHDDGVHLSSEGHAKLYEHIRSRIEPWLTEAHV